MGQGKGVAEPLSTTGARPATEEVKVWGKGSSFSALEQIDDDDDTAEHAPAEERWADVRNARKVAKRLAKSSSAAAGENLDGYLKQLKIEEQNFQE